MATTSVRVCLRERRREPAFEIQYLDYGSRVWMMSGLLSIPSPNATQGHAVESDFTPGRFGGWASLSASPWLYNLFKQGVPRDHSWILVSTGLSVPTSLTGLV